MAADLDGDLALGAPGTHSLRRLCCGFELEPARIHQGPGLADIDEPGGFTQEVAMVLASPAVEDGQEEYGSPAELLAILDEAIVAPAMARHAELLAQRARDLRVRRAADFLPRS